MNGKQLRSQIQEVLSTRTHLQYEEGNWEITADLNSTRITFYEHDESHLLIDKEFPPDDYSIYGSNIMDFKWDIDIKWERASEIYKEPSLFPKDREITPDDVI